MKTLDETKGNGGDYLKGRVGNEFHKQIYRNPPKFERDLGGGARWDAWSGERRRQQKRRNEVGSG
jgi:hypothetical protein